MGMRPVMASMPSDGEVQKAPVIQRTALRFIFFSSVMFFYDGGAFEEPQLKPI